jgi:hypothetical protein
MYFIDIKIFQNILKSKIRIMNKFFNYKLILFIILPRIVLICFPSAISAKKVISPIAPQLMKYNIVWNSQSKNSSESMPCGGGDIGLNVWVENGDILFYLSRSGTFDELNLFPKLGRIRVHFFPNPFRKGAFFRQELKLSDGDVEIIGKDNFKVLIWVDVFHPIVHIDMQGNKPVNVEAYYESWRIQDHQWIKPQEFNASRGYTLFQKNIREKYPAIVRKDNIGYEGNNVVWYHRNRDNGTIFDLTVEQQKLESVKDKIPDPLKNLTFGGMMNGDGMKEPDIIMGEYAHIPFKGWGLKSVIASKQHHLRIYLYIDNADSVDEWKNGLNNLVDISQRTQKNAHKNTINWWNQFWNRSYIFINPAQNDTTSRPWQVGRNYQVFRYQLGCNAYGKYPTKFNGGLFTFDPVYIDSSYSQISPDHRNWGGGTFTAQNQRLVYWPMLKSGDFDMMPSQFDFYNRILPVGLLRSQIYFKHKGACWGEQVEQFGLTCAGDYKWADVSEFPDGVEENAWLEYHWDTPLEICLMIMDLQRFTGQDVSKYMPLIENCIDFFFEHYLQEGRRNSIKPLTQDGKLIIYPGSALETYKCTYNSSCTIAGLQTLVSRLLEMPKNYLTEKQRNYWENYLKMVPPIPFRYIDGHKTIAPAVVWSRINGSEIPQLYPIFPYGLYGIGKPDLDVAINTWKYGLDNEQQRDYVSWHQNAIFCARLGLTDEAAGITLKKLGDSNRRFPTFWGPGHDWVPDHNWGGSGMIGLQEMLMQTDHRNIYLFPAWPKTWNVDFKLHAPYKTIVEGKLRDGKMIELRVTPQERLKDVIILNFK